MSKPKSLSQAIKLIQLIDKGELSPDQLTHRRRKIIIKYWMEDDLSFNTALVADQLGITQRQVQRIKRELIRDSEWMIDEVNVQAIAVNLKLRKDQLQRKAMAKEDYALVWQIEKDFITQVQGLGFAYRAPAELNVNVTQQNDFQIQLKELFSELGVPTREQFIALLDAAKGNGGNGRKLIEQTAGSGKDRPTTVDRRATRKRA